MTYLKKFKSTIRDYFGLEVPIWMQSRKNLFLFFSLDLLIFIFIITEKFSLDINFESLFLTITLSILWCLISYVNGKYSYFNSSNNILKKLYNLFNNILISLILIYLINKIILIFIPAAIPLSRNKIIYLGIISFILQSIRLFIYEMRSYKKKLYLMGNQEEINSFKEFIREFPILKYFDIVDNYDQVNNFQQKKLVLILNEKLYFKETSLFNLSEIDLSVEKITPFEWCERYIHRIPTIYLNKKEYQKHKWFSDSDNFQWRLKRFGDIVVSLFLIFFTIPIFLLSAFLIWLEDKGPILYYQVRTGLNGKKFKIIKLRTMQQNSEINGPVWASKNDKRITKIGSFLRRTRIDELPQLISVLLGDMSLIGPRPERPEIELTLNKHIPFYGLRKFIKPGLSGWAQVNYPYGASIKDSEIKLSYDLFYIRNQSFWLDFLIFIKTIKLIINMRGSKPDK